ncbi:MAG: hypothetical protein PHE27_00925, partial [Alphaproteobacteria bacterium]|nr:hypothetical protein [Alphaproteobacteria bacterium]
MHSSSNKVTGFDPGIIAGIDLESLADLLACNPCPSGPTLVFSGSIEAFCVAHNTAAVLVAGVLPLLDKLAWTGHELPYLLPTDCKEIRNAKSSCADVLASGELTLERKWTAISTVWFAAALLRTQGDRRRARGIEKWLEDNFDSDELDAAVKASPGLTTHTETLRSLDAKLMELDGGKSKDFQDYRLYVKSRLDTDEKKSASTATAFTFCGKECSYAVVDWDAFTKSFLRNSNERLWYTPPAGLWGNNSEYKDIMRPVILKAPVDNADARRERQKTFQQIAALLQAFGIMPKRDGTGPV